MIFDAILSENVEISPNTTRESAEDFGQRLYEKLFDEVLREVFRLRYAEHKIRLALEVDEIALPAVAALPWEFLYAPLDPESPAVRLATDARLTLCRYRLLREVAQPIVLEEEEKVRIQLVVANPPHPSKDSQSVYELPPVVYEDVKATLCSLAEQNLADIELLPTLFHAGVDELKEALRREPHILHFIGHGNVFKDHEQVGDGNRLALIDQDGLADWRRDVEVGEMFGHHRPALVYLQTCESARLHDGAAFAGIASHIVQRSIPAVVAMQYRISNADAAQFARTFYERLLVDKQPVDVAVQAGRETLFQAPGLESSEYAIPVVFTQVRDGRIFERTVPVDEPQYHTFHVQVRSRAPVTLIHYAPDGRELNRHTAERFEYPEPTRHELHRDMPDVQDFVGRDHPIQAATERLDQYKALAIVGRAGIGKSYLGAKLAHERATAREDIYWFAFKHAEVDMNAILWDLAVFLYEHDEKRPYEWLNQRSRDFETVTDLSERLDYVTSFLGGKGHVFCFDDAHRILGSSAEDNFHSLFQALEQLEKSDLLLMSREALPWFDELPLNEMDFAEFTKLLPQHLPDFPQDKALRQETFEKLTGVPRYLKLFGDMLRGEPLTDEVIRRHLRNLPSKNIATYMLDELRDKLTPDEQRIFEAISIFRQSPSVSLVCSTVRSSRLLDDAVLALESKIRDDLGGSRRLFKIDEEHVKLHDIEKDFWRDRLNPKDCERLNQAVLAVYESDPLCGVEALEAAYHAFEAVNALRSYEILREHQDDLINTGHAGGVLNQLKKFQAAQFEDKPQVWIDILMLRGSLQRHLGRYQDAADSHIEAQRTARRMGEAELRARALTELGRDRIFSGESEKAIRRLNQAKNFLQEGIHNSLLGAIYCRLAEANGQLPDFEQELKEAHKSIRLLESLDLMGDGDYKTLVWSNHFIFQAYLFTGMPDDALLFLEEAKDIVDLEIGSSIELVYTYSRLGIYYAQVVNDYDEAKRYIRLAIEINEEFGELERRVGDLSNLGQVFHETGDLLQSEQYLKQAFDLAFRIRSAHRFNVALNLSTLLRSQGRWLGSEKYIDKAKDVATTAGHQLDWRLSAIRLYRNMALFNEYDDEYFKEAKVGWESILKFLDDIQDIVSSPGNWGSGQINPEYVIESYALLGEVLACVEYHQRLLSILPKLEEQKYNAKKAKAKVREGHTWQALGIAYAVLDRFADADQAFDQALSIFEKHPYEKARTYYYQGRRYALQGEHARAEDAWRESLKLFRSLTAPGHENDYVRLLEATLTHHGFAVPAD